MKTLAILWSLAGLVPLIKTNAIESRTTRGKRGLAFAKGADNPRNLGKPGADYTQYFQGKSSIVWMYDWEGVIDGSAIDLEFVPMLHEDSPVFTGGWVDAVNWARENTHTGYVLSFNEPDLQCG
jgi:phenylpropionate dioxygenase-like ring-hydroxylating dioxygenase large terminal subunit